MSLEDKAQEHEAMIWSQNNTARPQAPTYAPEDAGYGPEECRICGADMHPVRRANGWRLCTPCQSERERATARR
jgi:hypothetical protein